MSNASFAKSLINFSVKINSASLSNSEPSLERVKASFIHEAEATQYIQLAKNVSACLCIRLGGEHHQGESLEARIDDLKNYATDKKKKCWMSCKLRGEVTCIEFNTDGSLLAVGLTYGVVSLWDVKKVQCVWSFKKHLYAVYSLAFDARDQQLVSVGGDQGHPSFGS